MIVKQEKIDSSPICTTIRPQRNKRNKMQAQDEQDPANTNQMEVKSKMEHMITETDTVDSLREKFPNVGPFELEFLLFLKGN